MKILRKDFVPEDTESYCGGRRLSSGTAYYMQDSNGKIHFGGKQCAEKHGENDWRDVPDLTMALKSLTTHTVENSQTNHSKKATSSKDDRKLKALDYLILRAVKLKDFSIEKRKLSYTKLDEYYLLYQENGELDDDIITHILNMENYAKEKINRRLSLPNLLTCYAYKYILERVLVHLQKKGNNEGEQFITSLQSYLSTHCYLTEKQISGLKNWLQFLPKELREAKLESFKG